VATAVITPVLLPPLARLSAKKVPLVATADQSSKLLTGLTTTVWLTGRLPTTAVKVRDGGVRLSGGSPTSIKVGDPCVSSTKSLPSAPLQAVTVTE
jgi:hypothetical protein